MPPLSIEESKKKLFRVRDGNHKKRILFNVRNETDQVLLSTQKNKNEDEDNIEGQIVTQGTRRGGMMTLKDRANASQGNNNTN